MSTAVIAANLWDEQGDPGTGMLRRIAPACLNIAADVPWP
jgi:hypothetical protein